MVDEWLASYLPFEQVKQPVAVVITIARQSTSYRFFSVYMYCRLIIFVQIVNNAMNCMQDGRGRG